MSHVSRVSIHVTVSYHIQSVQKSWFNMRQFYWPIEQVLWPIFVENDNSYTSCVRTSWRKSSLKKSNVFKTVLFFTKKFGEQAEHWQGKLYSRNPLTEIKKIFSMAENC